MAPDQARAGPEYPVVSAQDATLRADHVLTSVGLDTDVGLEDRLERAFRAWMDHAGAGHLAQEVKRLYWLLIDPSRTQADKPVDVIALRRSLILAMSRPAEDECWRDYQRIEEAIYQRWIAVSAILGRRPLWSLVLRRHGPTHDELRAREQEWQGPISAARAQFIAKWRG